MESIFLQYGALGACMVTFMAFFYKYYSDTIKFQDSFKVLVENNTIALTKVYEVVAHCPQIKRKI